MEVEFQRCPPQTAEGCLQGQVKENPHVATYLGTKKGAINTAIEQEFRGRRDLSKATKAQYRLNCKPSHGRDPIYTTLSNVENSRSDEIENSMRVNNSSRGSRTSGMGARRLLNNWLLTFFVSFWKCIPIWYIVQPYHRSNCPKILTNHV